MKVLVVYYSLTGQAATASNLAVEALQEAGATVTVCRVDFADPAI
jgi:flavodoxin